MLSKERVGMRIRQVRTAQNKTLRDVESASGFSSTHISEIERGRTCPTIGALVQIASALEKDASYFIEDRELEEICVTGGDDRRPVSADGFRVDGSGIVFDGLTSGILGGRLQVFEFALEAGAQGRVSHLPESADLGFFVETGEIVLAIGERELSLGTGSSLHGMVEGGFELRNAQSLPARFLMVLDPGTVIP